MATMTKTRTWTVLELINWSKGYLEEKGFGNARLEVELLLSHALDVPRVELYVGFDRQMKQDELALFKALLKRRLAGEPVQYVTGTAAFMMGEYEVNPAVLIPRPETEALTEVVLKMLAERAGAVSAEGESTATAGRAGTESADSGETTPVVRGRAMGGSGGEGRELLVADIGTGSGVIAATVAAKMPSVRVYATDVSAEALEVAARNAGRAGVAGRVAFLTGDMLRPLLGDGLAGKLTAVVSNPPYVPSGELAGLPAEVRDFEPHEALDGGQDGLDCIRALVQDGPGLLAPGGFLALEVGDGQAQTVAALMRDRLENVEVHRDYAGRERIVTGCRRAE